MGSFDRLRVYAWNPKMSIWEETAQKDIKNLYTVTALAWKRDGFRVAVSNLGGSILFFETGIICFLFILHDSPEL